MRGLYPDIEPYRTTTLDVGDDHMLYVEECAKVDGIPVVFLHGGPGAGCEPWQRRFFNPEKFRVILFDQRGCGRSIPHGELAHNTTADLINDMERLRCALGIERWLIFGGSWGSTLALAYAEQCPKRCLGLILRGIFLCRPQDIHWFYQSGANKLFPDLWRDFEAVIPTEERGDMVAAYYRRLTDADEAVRIQAALAWSAWEGKTLSLIQNNHAEAFFTRRHTALSLARIECHYFINQIFMHENELLEQAHRLCDIPGVIVHGRYDVVCPIEQAFVLHEYWPQAEMKVIAAAGHAASEPEILSSLVTACDVMAQRLQP